MFLIIFAQNLSLVYCLESLSLKPMKGLGVVYFIVLEPYSIVFLQLDELTRKIKLFKQGILLYATSKIGT